MSQNTKISAGEVIVLTHGSYSDYGIIGYFVARVDFDLAEALAECFPNVKDREEYGSQKIFLAWLVTTEKLVPVSHREIYIGEYGGVDLS